MQPVGFALYINKPNNYIPEGLYITSFIEYDYEEVIGADIIIPKLEVNSNFSGDYRTKSEINNLNKQFK